MNLLARNDALMPIGKAQDTANIVDILSVPEVVQHVSRILVSTARCCLKFLSKENQTSAINIRTCLVLVCLRVKQDLDKFQAGKQFVFKTHLK